MTREKLPDVLIREMKEADLAFAAKCTAAEGWVAENLTTLEGFFLHDPKGCFVAEENGRRVGICVATFYGNSGFIGELIVRPEARGRGVGAELLNHGVQILIDRGVKTVYLDGEVRAVGLYQRNGFRKICRSCRFSGHLSGKLSSKVRQMATSDLDQVFKLDRSSFGEDRSFFLRRRLYLFPELCYVMVDGDRLTGFILGRGGEDWVSAGPWVVSEDAENPIDLISAFTFKVGERPISIGILETNPQACDLVRSIGLQERVESPWRMALGKPDDLGASPRCYAVGSGAKG